MQLPVVAPLDGTSMTNTLRQLSEVRNNLSNIGSGNWSEVLLAYQRWASMSAESLGYCFDHAAIELLITTRRHWWLMDQLPTRDVRELGPAIQDAFRAEQTDRRRVLDALIGTFTSISRDWEKVAGRVVVADTNVYAHNELYWDEIDWASVVGDGDVRLMIPNVVLRELDRHKRSDRSARVSDTNPELLRTRARVSSRRIREAFDRPHSIVRMQGRANYEAELLLNDLGHTPVDDADTEIITRAVDLQRLISHPVTLVTGDGNMQFQAEIAGLQVVKLYEAGH